MRWLLLTDLHVGGKSQSQTDALEGLTDAVLQFANERPLDAVIMTGDLAYSGTASQYKTLDELVVRRLKSSSILREAGPILAVPGNHDMDCSLSLPTPWDGLGEKRREMFFENSEAGIQVREPRAKAFRDYSEYLKRSEIKGPIPTERCSTTVRLESQQTKVDFVGLVTAYFSDMYVSDEDRSPAPAPALRAELSRLDNDSVVLVLGHHPIQWFAHNTQERFRSLLFDKPAVYVHGHMHDVRLRSSTKGVESIGFGASYQASLDASPDPYYENSFAVCEIVDSWLHVAIVTWDARHGQWRECTKLPAEFHKKSSLLHSGYELPLPRTERRRARVTSGLSPAIVADDRVRTKPLNTERVISIGLPADRAWRQLLFTAKIFQSQEAPRRVASVDGYTEYVEGSHLVCCIGGHGNVMSTREVEAYNTKLDTGEHEAITVVSLGEIEAAKVIIQMFLKVL